MLNRSTTLFQGSTPRGGGKKGGRVMAWGYKSRGGAGLRSANQPAIRLVARLAAIELAMTALPVLDTAETALEGGRNLSTWAAAVLKLPATSVVMPASTETLHLHVHRVSRRAALCQRGLLHVRSLQVKPVLSGKFTQSDM